MSAADSVRSHVKLHVELQRESVGIRCCSTSGGSAAATALSILLHRYLFMQQAQPTVLRS